MLFLAERVEYSGSACALERVASLEALEALSGEWDRLVLGMPRPSPFLLHGWLVEWWRHFGVGGQLTIVLARRQGRLVGAAPLYVRRVRGVRVARFLGGRESSLADLLTAADEPESLGRLLADEIRRLPFDYVDLYGLPGGSKLGSVFGVPLVERVKAPVLLMPDGWDVAYSAKTSSKKRNMHKRRLRQLGQLGKVEFVVGRTFDELDSLLEAAFHLHELRWRGRPDGSTFGTERGRGFHRAALRRLADDGVLRIVLMRVAGRPAAFHYFFALEGAMVSHRLGFDPALYRYSPGLVATLETLRVASQERLTRVEFLGNDDRYKVELADRFEPLSEAIGLARNPVGSVAARGLLGSILARKALRRSERLHRIYLGGFGRSATRGGRGSVDRLDGGS